jgi:hypothetical protein
MRVFFLGLAAMFVNTAIAAESPTKSTALFNGADLKGWRYVTPTNNDISSICHVKPDGVLAVDAKPNGFIATNTAYENYRLHVEWRWSDKPGNGGILVHITEGPMDRIWPVSIQIQTKNTRVGDLLPMSVAKFAEPLTPEIKTPTLNRQSADSEKPVGEWNSCDILCRGDTIEVSVNGVAQNRVTKCLPASGQIGFQIEGVPFELRNIRLEPLPAAIGSSPQSAASR